MKNKMGKIHHGKEEGEKMSGKKQSTGDGQAYEDAHVTHKPTVWPVLSSSFFLFRSIVFFFFTIHAVKVVWDQYVRRARVKTPVSYNVET